MTLVSKNVYIDTLVDIVNKYNSTYNSTIKMKSADLKSRTYINFKKIFAKNYNPNWSKEAFVKKFKSTLLWTYFISDLNGEKIAWMFYQKELQKTNQKEFRVEKSIKEKGDKLYVKWRGYDNYFSS